MEKNISKSKGLVISVCALLIILACSMLLTACHTVYLFHELAYHGYSIRTIIYTDDVAKYAAGRERVYELELSSSSSLTFEDDHCNWLLATDREYVYDLIINTNEIMSNGEEGLPFSYGAEMYNLYTTGNYAQYTAFDNSYLFSGIDGRYMAGGPIECEDKRCNCGFLYDDFDNCCQCDRNISYNISNSEKLTEEQVRDIVYNENWANQDIYCEACYTVEEYENSDGTYDYYFHNSCNHQAELIHDGTFSRPLTSWMQLFRENTLLSFKFKELIIDGYDFSILYDALSNYDYSKKYVNWESYPDFNNFSHMFSDLPVEKIVIKRVSGLGDKAVDLSSMFENCINLRTVEFGNLFEGCKPKNISRMFYNCPNLKEVDLTSLDTSETTNMSEMFSVGTSSITFDERKAMVEEYINTVLVEEENLDPTETYTVESYAEYNNVSEEEVYLGLLYTKRLRYPATYDEACRFVYGAGFTDFVKVAMANPESVGFRPKLDGGVYEIYEIVDHLENMAAAFGINAIYPADFFAHDSRDEYVEYIINNLVVELLDGYEDTPYTVETFAEEVDMTKEELLLNIATKTGLDVPLTYNEACLAYMGKTFEEVVDIFNTDPESLGVTAKPDNEPYTEEEVMELIQIIAQEMEVTVLSSAELEDKYVAKEVTPRGTLILGGDDSKFVINNGVDTTDIFGEYCYFNKVVAPNVMGDEVELELTKTFSHNNEDVVTRITGQDSSKVFIYKEVVAEPETPIDPIDPVGPTNPENPGVENTTPEKPKTEDEDNNLMIILIASGGTLVLTGGVTTTVVVIKKKKKPMTIKDQKL